MVIFLMVGLCFQPRTSAETAKCHAKDPINALWLLAENCKGDQGCYTSCRRSNPDDQYVVTKDFRWTKNHAYLIIPSTRMKGIESPEVFDAPFVNLWQYGWEVAKQCPGQPAPHTGLAINSECSRTEEQLHIHISCVRSAVQQCLQEKDKKGEISSELTRPTELALGPVCNTYKVVKVSSLRGKDSPFKVVQHFPGVSDGNMREQSIAVIGSETPEKFYVLDTYHHDANVGGAEELLNQDCSDWLRPDPAKPATCTCR
jgi:CDP-diacylglycerol pyrophosphatase